MHVATITQTEALSKETVPALKGILSAMGVEKGLSGKRKGDLIEMIITMRGIMEEIAYQDQAEMDEAALRSPDAEKNEGTDFWTRTKNYTRQNKGRKLTAAQQRRAFKKYKHQLGKGYTMATVMGKY